MKTESTNRVKLGIFVITGLVLFLAAIYFIGSRQQLFSETFRVNTLINDVSGLQIGNNVRFAGINVGTVEHIEIVNDTTVKVAMIIDSETKRFMKRDARAVIGSDGLMGSKIMNIIAGSPQEAEIEHDAVISSVKPMSIDEVLVKLKVTADNAALLSNDLSAIFSNMRQGKGTMGKLLMDQEFANHLDQALINIELGTRGFKENMDAASNSILLRGYFKKKKKEAEKNGSKTEEDKEVEESEKVD